MNDDSNSLYTDEEIELLKKTKDIRLSFVKGLVDHSKPNDRDYSSKARVTNELLTSLDKNIHDSVTNRLKFKDNADNESILTSVAETLKAISVQKSEGVVADLKVDTKVKEIDIDKAELEIQPDKLLLEDFVEKD